TRPGTTSRSRPAGWPWPLAPCRPCTRGAPPPARRRPTCEPDLASSPTTLRDSGGGSQNATPQVLATHPGLGARRDDGLRGHARARDELREGRLLLGARDLVDLRRAQDHHELRPGREEREEVGLL